ncbi:MAG TPA: TIGR02679 family protein [Ktedonobacterales bacterium]|nr:TIGR02679 family protein [Ktedonobacterales bacterium]
MNTPYEPTTNLERAVAFFEAPVWSRLLTGLYDKYMRQGDARGQVTLRACTPEEQREIARFLRKRLPPQSDVTIRLADFQTALSESGFACDLRALLAAYFPERPQITRPEQQEQRAAAQQRFSDALASLADELPDDSAGKCWLLSGAHGREAIFRRYKNEPLEAKEQLLRYLRVIVDALNHLPVPPAFERLSRFAQRISGDPHFFDAQRATGRLFLRALMDLSWLEHPSMPADSEIESEVLLSNERDRPMQELTHWRLLLYYDAGLLLDTISSTVAVFHLSYAEDEAGQTDRLVESAGERILVLPLRQLLAWKKLAPASQHIYLFENPQVFEMVVDTLSSALVTGSGKERKPLPTLICTAGWPSVAALRLLSLLTESSPEVVLHYSGDFDLQGLRIAAHLLARYPHHCRLWCFDPSAYLAALHHQSASLDEDERVGLQTLPAEFAELADAMRENGRKAYQEGILPLLLQSIQNSST